MSDERQEGADGETDVTVPSHSAGAAAERMPPRLGPPPLRLVDGSGGGTADVRVIGPYQGLVLLGQGGMAEVLLARKRGIAGFEKLVVLKCIYPHLARQKYFLDMFLDEARLAALIRDPHVVDIYELGSADGTVFIAMEYLPGESCENLLRVAVRQRRPIGAELAARIVAEAAAGLHAAHELRDPSGELLDLVHRDVSPGNIMILYGGGVKMLDFGVAKAHGRLAETIGREVKGKLAYMSPEQVRGMGVDRRSDVFSLGVVLWEMLTLRRLYKAANQAATLRLIVEGEPPAPSVLRHDVPHELDAIVLRALAKRPENRFQTAEEMRTELERFLAASSRSGVMQLAELMRGLFSERIEARKRLMAKLANAGPDLPVRDIAQYEVLLGEVSEEPPELSHSVSADVHVAMLALSRRRARRRLLLGTAALVLFAVIVGLVSRIGHAPSNVTQVVVHPAPQTGYARIEASPADLRLTLDGRVLGGPPPLLLPNLSKGKYVLVGSAPGFAEARRAFEIEPGAQNTVELSLEPLPTATLTIKSKPSGAVVMLDGVAVGLTPITRRDLRPEVGHTLRVERDGYVTREHSFTPAPDQRVSLNWSLKRTGAVPRRTGRLYFNTTPWSVVYHGNRRLGETPLLGVTLPEGRVRLRAENPGTGKQRTFDVDIRAGKIQRMNERL